MDAANGNSEYKTLVASGAQNAILCETAEYKDGKYVSAGDFNARYDGYMAHGGINPKDKLLFVHVGYDVSSGDATQ